MGFIKKERIVHLDLKGAPLKLSYLEKVIHCIKSWGATGVLLEWEDTFPYIFELVDVGSSRGCGGDGLYTRMEVENILKLCKEVGLEAIQLIQTMGHMEFVLKHQSFSKLRETPKSPASLCPSQSDSQVLVRMMIDQVLNVQPDAVYFHIGADEVWSTGVCDYCKNRAATNRHGSASLYLDHIQNMALYIKEKRPNLTILMWDDMLRSIDIETLRHYHLSELVTPVLWHYFAYESFAIEKNLLDAYNTLFSNTWAASAFKGANGSCKLWSPVARYFGNNQAWIQLLRDNPQLNFTGIILTGWSRYDHYAALCELMPVSLPSLASCLKLLSNYEGDDIQIASSIITEELPLQEWPGHELAKSIHVFIDLRERCLNFIHSDHVQTWLNPWQLENNYTNPSQIEGLYNAANELVSFLEQIRPKLVTHLHDITGRRSADEWVGSYVTPVQREMEKIRDGARNRCYYEPSVVPVKYEDRKE